MKRRTFLSGVATVLVASIAVVTGASQARAGTTAVPLGTSGFGSIAIDDTNGHVFVSQPTSNQVRVFDLDGNPVKTIGNLPGAYGMVIHGSSLYVAENALGAIEVIDLASLTDVGQLASGLFHAQWIAFAGNRLWVTVDTQYAGYGELASVALDGTTTVLNSSSYYSPDLSTSPALPNLLYVGEDFLSGGRLIRFDVSSGSPVDTAHVTPNAANKRDYAVTPDGTRLLFAAGAPYEFDELSPTTLTPDGVTYPGQPYPSAVAVSSGQGGLVATGLTSGYSTPDISVYGEGWPISFFTASTNTSAGIANVLSHGLAFTADGSKLFAVTSADIQSTPPTLWVFDLPANPRTPTTTTVSTAPNPSPTGGPVTITATVAPSTATGSVAFFADGYPLPGCSATPLSSGTATCSVSSLGEGVSTIMAAYSGDSSYRGSTGSTTQTVRDSFEVDLQRVRDSLDAYRQQNPSPKSTFDHLTAAVGHLGKALTPSLWQPDGRHLTSSGATVFNEDKAAVDELMKIAAPRPQVATDAIGSIVALDRAIAQLQYDDANALISSITPTNASEYQKAKSELAAASSELTKGIQSQTNNRWDDAIGHFKNAWQDSVYAVQDANLAR